MIFIWKSWFYIWRSNRNMGRYNCTPRVFENMMLISMQPCEANLWTPNMNFDFSHLLNFSVTLHNTLFWIADVQIRIVENLPMEHSLTSFGQGIPQAGYFKFKMVWNLWMETAVRSWLAAAKAYNCIFPSKFGILLDPPGCLCPFAVWRALYSGSSAAAPIYHSRKTLWARPCIWTATHDTTSNILLHSSPSFDLAGRSTQRA